MFGLLWRLTKEEYSPQVDRYRFESEISRAGFLELLAHSSDFGLFLCSELRAARFAAYFFETPPICNASAQSTMEFVLVDAPALDGISADRLSFASYFSESQPAVSFTNLGGDARLVVPCPQAGLAIGSYSSLAPFVRNASDEQLIALWQTAGRECLARLGARPFWLSTSGLGVYWVHLRLDDAPKYYQFAGYRNLDAC